MPQAPSQCLGSYLLALSRLYIAVLLDGIKGKGYGFKYLITFSQLYGIQKYDYLLINKRNDFSIAGSGTLVPWPNQV